MTDQEWLGKWLDEKLDPIASELGLSEEMPPEQLTYELGFRFGSKLKDLLPIEQDVYDHFAMAVLENFAEIFPLDPDDDARALQVLLFAPMVSVALTGRGLSVPELAEVAGIGPAQAYRVWRRGLSIFYKPADPKPRTGVHREYSGVDGRKSRFTVDHENILAKQWPEPISEIQPFLLGLIDGGKSCLADPKVRAEIEKGLKAAFLKALRDPVIGDIVEGGVQAALRLVQGLRDAGMLLTSAELERSQRAIDLLLELRTHKSEILSVARDAAREIESSAAISG